jgi:hypothetical protein
LLVLSLALVGVQGVVGYLRLLLDASAWGDQYGIHPSLMHTWRGLLLRMAGSEAALVGGLWVVGAGVALAVLAWVWRGDWAAQSARFDARWALLIVTMLFVSPHAYAHDLALLLVAGALAARCWVELRAAGATCAWWLILLPVAGWLAASAATLNVASLQQIPSVLLQIGGIASLACAAGRLTPRAIVL